VTVQAAGRNLDVDIAASADQVGRFSRRTERELRSWVTLRRRGDVGHPERRSGDGQSPRPGRWSYDAAEYRHGPPRRSLRAWDWERPADAAIRCTRPDPADSAAYNSAAVSASGQARPAFTGAGGGRHGRQWAAHPILGNLGFSGLAEMVFFLSRTPTHIGLTFSIYNGGMGEVLRIVGAAYGSLARTTRRISDYRVAAGKMGIFAEPCNSGPIPQRRARSPATSRLRMLAVRRENWP